MRPSIKYPTVLMPRPTRASLDRQLKIRNSMSTSSIINTEEIKSENDLRTIGLTIRTAVIISSSSLDNSTSDGETLEQVIAPSLTENVRKLDLIESNNKENYSSIDHNSFRTNDY